MPASPSVLRSALVPQFRGGFLLQRIIALLPASPSAMHSVLVVQKSYNLSALQPRPPPWARLTLRHAFHPCAARLNTPASMGKSSCLALRSCTLGIRSASLSLIARTLALCPCAAESLTVSASFPCPPLRASHPALRPVLAQQEFDSPALAQWRVSSSGPRRPLLGSHTAEDSARQPHISSLTALASLTARYSAAPCPTGR